MRTDIILNLEEHPSSGRPRSEGDLPGALIQLVTCTSGMVEADGDVERLDKDVYRPATVSEGGKPHMEMRLKRGAGDGSRRQETCETIWASASSRSIPCTRPCCQQRHGGGGAARADDRLRQADAASLDQRLRSPLPTPIGLETESLKDHMKISTTFLRRRSRPLRLPRSAAGNQEREPDRLVQELELRVRSYNRRRTPTFRPSANWCSRPRPRCQATKNFGENCRTRSRKNSTSMGAMGMKIDEHGNAAPGPASNEVLLFAYGATTTCQQVL